MTPNNHRCFKEGNLQIQPYHGNLFDPVILSHYHILQRKPRAVNSHRPSSRFRKQRNKRRSSQPNRRPGNRQTECNLGNQNRDIPTFPRIPILSQRHHLQIHHHNFLSDQGQFHRRKLSHGHRPVKSKLHQTRRLHRHHSLSLLRSGRVNDLHTHHRQAKVSEVLVVYPDLPFSILHLAFHHRSLF